MSRDTATERIPGGVAGASRRSSKRLRRKRLRDAARARPAWSSRCLLSGPAGGAPALRHRTEGNPLSDMTPRIASHARRVAGATVLSTLALLATPVRAAAQEVAPARLTLGDAAR